MSTGEACPEGMWMVIILSPILTNRACNLSVFGDKIEQAKQDWLAVEVLRNNRVTVNKISEIGF